jgi:endonuclease-8
MPEGDTIHRFANAIGRDLTGRRLEHLELHDLGTVTELRGARVEQVAARGKHLLVHLEGDWSLRVHLGMKGRWRRIGAGRPPPGRPTVLIQAGGRQWACVRAYQAELVRTGRLKTHPRLARLGPDLLADPPEIDAAVRRAQLPAHARREIGDALLDQRIASGIGNVYKSEVLFVRRIHPRTPVASISDEQLRGLFDEVARLMSANLRTIRRTSVPLQRRTEPASPRLWVYDRAGNPCLECGTKIERIVQGDLARSTYFCPECQSAGFGPEGEGPSAF